MVHLKKQHICQNIVLQNSMFPLLRKISANWLAICDADPFFFRFVAALLSDISQAKKAQERQADMQVDVVPHAKSAGTCYVLMYYL